MTTYFKFSYQLSRHELIKEKVIDNVEVGCGFYCIYLFVRELFCINISVVQDDNDADLLRGIRNIPSMIILSGDDDPL